MMDGIYEMMLIGDMWGVQSIAQQLMEREHRFAPFFSQIDKYADAFEEEKLRTFMKKHLGLEVH